ncbi:META and DUF4377 domain-containing protein [Endozoicomonas ascidiicola]|uniref:META and DUF4377 domain-containing protein n=1 Tax=Endozoicomonas ascidiicola TaxID=1698521 RepID=UPI000832A40A|nr:META and DUF4377 domain-containing protein [Endozoicomonas ascidiicola]
MKCLQSGVIAMSAFLIGCTTLPEGNWQESAPMQNPPMTLDIQKDRLSAYAGCNRMFGSAKMSGEHLVVGQLASTMMACFGEGADREEQLKQLLSSEPQVQLSDTHLVLSSGEISYVFEKMPDMSKGLTRFIYVAPEKAECMGVAPMECLQIRESEEEPWALHFGNIEGFDFQEGNAYRLRIKEFDVPNPPADASSKRWILDLIVETEWVGNE